MRSLCRCRWPSVFIEIIDTESEVDDGVVTLEQMIMIIGLGIILDQMERMN